MSAKAKRILITTESYEVWTVRPGDEHFAVEHGEELATPAIDPDSEVVLYSDESANRREIVKRSSMDRTVQRRGYAAEFWRATKALLTK